jgi:hypothetical protein
MAHIDTLLVSGTHREAHHFIAAPEEPRAG